MTPNTSHHQDDQTISFSQNPMDPKTHQRREAMLLLAAGCPVRQVAQQWHVSPTTVRRWHKRYLAEGLAGLEARRRGRPPNADAAYRELLVFFLSVQPASLGYDFPRWTVACLRRSLEEETGIGLSDRRFRDLLHRLGYRWQWIRPLLRPMPAAHSGWREYSRMLDEIPAAALVSRLGWARKPLSGEGVDTTERKHGG